MLLMRLPSRVKTTRLMSLPCTVARNPEVQVACGVRSKLVVPLRVVVRFGLLAWLACVIRAFAAAAAAVPEPLPVPVPVPVPVPDPVPVDVDPVLQRLLSRTLLINVTAPMRASRRPITVAPLSSEMLCSAMRLPWNAVVVPSEAEAPTCQKTLHGLAPLRSTTELAEAVVRDEA